MASRIYQFFVSSVLEMPGLYKSLDELIAELDRSGKRTLAELTNKPETPQNCDKLSHIIGIERWGQRRLLTLLGEPLLQDEYDGYRPANSLAMKALKDLFRESRATSLVVARKLAENGISPSTKVRHNSIGELSVEGWLRYFSVHADRTLSRMK